MAIGAFEVTPLEKERVHIVFAIGAHPIVKIVCLAPGFGHGQWDRSLSADVRK